jgi:hypothetical protein
MPVTKEKELPLSLRIRVRDLPALELGRFTVATCEAPL